MRTTQEVQQAFSSLGSILEKFLRVSKIPIEFMPGETLYPSEIHAISWVTKHAPVSVSEVGKAFSTTKGASSQIVTKLVERGFLQKEPDPEKLSRILVTVTDKGRNAHEKHMEFHMEHDKEFIHYLASMTPEQAAMFEQLCEKMHLWMDSYLE